MRPHLPLVVPPQTAYVYSNAGVNVAGFVAEVVARAFFADLMHTLLFEPLRMRRTTFDPTVAMAYPLAQGHEQRDDGTVRVQHRFFQSTADNPSGGAYSSVLDLATVALLHLHDGLCWLVLASV